MKNIVLFPGSFDPIHNGHIQMAKKASTLLNAEVIFIPAVISVWKLSSAEYKDKVEMIKLCIKDDEKLSISEYENTTGKQINYSIDTIKHFKEMYKDENLYLLIGEDQVNEFHRWKNAEEIASLVNIVFFQRPDIKDEQENINKFHMTSLEGVFSPASSSNIRDLSNLDTPYEVLMYIADNELYYFNDVKRFIKGERLSHSKEVAKLAYKLAKTNNLDVSNAYVAGLLHDIGKEVEEVEKLKIMDSHYKQYCELPKFAYHQFVGEYIAKNTFGIKDESILKAIKFHATGNSEMDNLAKIIYSADKIEPTRGFDSKDLIDACEANIESGFITVLKANKEYLTSKNKDINNELTSKCFDQYL